MEFFAVTDGASSIGYDDPGLTIMTGILAMYPAGHAPGFHLLNLGRMNVQSAGWLIIRPTIGPLSKISNHMDELPGALADRFSLSVIP